MYAGSDLPFRVVLVRKKELFDRSIAIRFDAYSRHGHPFAGDRPEIEPEDSATESIILLAEDKASGEPLGSVRLAFHRDASKTLVPDFELPTLAKVGPVVSVSRLAVARGGKARLVRLALGKTIFLYAVALQCRSVLAFVTPPKELLYYRNGFVDAVPGGPLFPYEASSGLPARMLFLDVWKYEGLLSGQDKALHQFIFETYHPDIEAFFSLASPFARKRLSDAPNEALSESTMLWKDGFAI